MSLITREEVLQDRYYDQLAEDAWAAAERQARDWHDAKYPLCSKQTLKVFGEPMFVCHHRLEAVKSCLTEATRTMSVEQQQDYVLNGRTRKRP